MEAFRRILISIQPSAVCCVDRKHKTDIKKGNFNHLFILAGERHLPPPPIRSASCRLKTDCNSKTKSLKSSTKVPRTLARQEEFGILHLRDLRGVLLTDITGDKILKKSFSASPECKYDVAQVRFQYLLQLQSFCCFYISAPLLNARAMHFKEHLKVEYRHERDLLLFKDARFLELNVLNDNQASFDYMSVLITTAQRNSLLRRRAVTEDRVLFRRH